MPTPYSNFTTPDNPNAPVATGAGQGAPANAVWNPVTKRWEGGSTGAPMPGPTPRPEGTTWDMDSKSWVPASTGTSNATAKPYGGDGTTTYGEPETEGRVLAFDGKSRGGGAWGGYAGTNVLNPDGSITYDPTMNGANATIGRMQGLGAAAANRDAYKIDYSQANQDAANGAQARDGQSDAMGISRNAAIGGSTPARQLGWKMLQQGANTQQAAAMSTRGGGLAQAAAMRQQQAGAGAYWQQGRNSQAALRADEMAAGRQEYMQQGTQQRNQDATAMGLNNQQTVEQLNQETAQNELNQTGQLRFEEMGQGVDKAAQDAATKAHEIGVGIDAAASLRGQRGADRDLGYAGAGVAAGGTLVAGLANSSDPDDPSKKYGSDERLKQNARPMGLAAAAMRRGY